MYKTILKTLIPLWAAFLWCLFILPLTVSAQNLFVGTYNIRNNSNNGDRERGNGWEQRLPAICGQVNFEQPDIFGTQEVLIEQVRDLADNLPGYAHIGVGRDDGREAGEHECIWYRTDRLQLIENGDFWLSETPDRPSLGWDAACIRICTWGKFTVKDEKDAKPFFYFNLHMDHIGIVARREAAKLIVKKIEEIAKGAPVIVTGDYNVDQRNEIYTIFTSSGLLKDSYTAAKQRFAENGTFNSFDPTLKSESRIDHIFVSPSVSVEHYAVMTNMYWTPVADTATQLGHDAPQEISFQPYQLRTPSDHYPVWAKIVL